MFAADQQRLLAHRQDWLERLRRGDVVVGGLPASDPRYGNNPVLARRIGAVIAARHRLRSLPDPLEPRSVFELQDPVRSVAVSPRNGSKRARM